MTVIDVARVLPGIRDLRDRLTDEVVGALVPGATVGRLAMDIAAIGYPARSGARPPAGRRRAVRGSPAGGAG